MSRSTHRSPDHPLVGALRLATLVSLAAAFAAVLLPGRAGTWAGGVMLGILIAAPVLRVVRLAWAWRRAGDTRFALLAVGLLVVLAASPVVALFSG